MCWPKTGIVKLLLLLPQHAVDVKHLAYEDNNHCFEEHDKEHDQLPCMTGGDLTHSLYRSTADVTRICAHVINTAAVAVFLNSHQ